MRYGSQDDLAALTVVPPRTQRGPEPPLDHRNHGLDLPPLAITLLITAESQLHPAPPASGGQLLGWTPTLWGDNRSRTTLPHTAMHPLGVEVGVSQKGADSCTGNGLIESRSKLRQIRARPAAGCHAKDHVVLAVDDEDCLRKVGVNRPRTKVSTGLAALHVISAGVPRFQTRTVHGRQRDSSLVNPVTAGLLENRIEETTGWRRSQQSLGSLLEGRVVRNAAHSDQSDEIGMIDEVCSQTTVVETRELLEHETSQQLGLSELLGAELVPVIRHGPAAAVVGDLEHSTR
jgi:hypothetical protein